MENVNFPEDQKIFSDCQGNVIPNVAAKQFNHSVRHKIQGKLKPLNSLWRRFRQWSCHLVKINLNTVEFFAKQLLLPKAKEIERKRHFRLKINPFPYEVLAIGRASNTNLLAIFFCALVASAKTERQRERKLQIDLNVLK